MDGDVICGFFSLFSHLSRFIANLRWMQRKSLLFSLFTFCSWWILVCHLPSSFPVEAETQNPDYFSHVQILGLGGKRHQYTSQQFIENIHRNFLNAYLQSLYFRNIIFSVHKEQLHFLSFSNIFSHTFYKFMPNIHTGKRSMKVKWPSI